VFTITTIRERLTQAGRVVQVVQRQPGWVTKLALVAGFVVMGAIALVLVIPAVLITLVFFFVGAAIAGLRSFLTRSKQPNGLLDGRKNVRVVSRQDP
jgi:cell division protein FtsX